MNVYHALYRKYRPKDFDSVVGQDSIIKTLIDKCATLESRVKTLETSFTTLQQTTIPNLVKRIQALENK